MSQFKLISYGRLSILRTRYRTVGMSKRTRSGAYTTSDSEVSFVLTPHLDGIDCIVVNIMPHDCNWTLWKR